MQESFCFRIFAFGFQSIPYNRVRAVKLIVYPEDLVSITENLTDSLLFKIHCQPLLKKNYQNAHRKRV